MSAALTELERARYLSLTTFRKSGVAVAVPVWAACDDGLYYIFSAGGAGKVKRLRNSTRARLAKCDARGKVLGDWHDAEAHILQDADQIATALRALRRKYGLQMLLADIGAKLLGKFDKRAYIGVTLAG